MRALMISADQFEDADLIKPRKALEAEGIEVVLATPDGDAIQGKKGASVEADAPIDEVDAANFHLLVLPGGKAPAKLRRMDNVLSIAKAFFADDKPVAAICHGPQILASADLLRGRKATAYSSVGPEVTEAGGDFLDEEVVVDGNLITSRNPSDIPAFVRAIKEKLAERT
jgi:protease I